MTKKLSAEQILEGIQEFVEDDDYPIDERLKDTVRKKLVPKIVAIGARKATEVVDLPPKQEGVDKEKVVTRLSLVGLIIWTLYAELGEYLLVWLQQV